MKAERSKSQPRSPPVGPARVSYPSKLMKIFTLLALLVFVSVAAMDNRADSCHIAPLAAELTSAEEI